MNGRDSSGSERALEKGYISGQNRSFLPANKHLHFSGELSATNIGHLRW